MQVEEERKSIHDEKFELAQRRLDWELEGMTDRQREILQPLLHRPTLDHIQRAEKIANAMYLANYIRARLNSLEHDLSKTSLLYAALKFIDANDGSWIERTTSQFEEDRFELISVPMTPRYDGLDQDNYNRIFSGRRRNEDVCEDG